jgi:ParB-like chromosome segregation protein Spo0J
MDHSRVVALDSLGESLSALRLCSERERIEMERSLRRHGQLGAILCWPVGDSLEVVDGFKRVAAARALGLAELRAELVEGDPAAAKLRLWQANRASGLSEIEQSWVIRALYREDGISQPGIALLLGRDKSWVCRRLMLAEGLATEVEAQVRLGLLSATAARELARLPRGNQEAAAQVAVRRGLTTRQLARLIDALLLAEDPGAREQILARASEATSEADRKRPGVRLSPAEWLVSEVARAKRTCVRLQVGLLQRPLTGLERGAAELVRQSLLELRGSLHSLSRTIDQIERGEHVQIGPS